jgi:digalactosyldiacylglycerol synthase
MGNNYSQEPQTTLDALPQQSSIDSSSSSSNDSSSSSSASEQDTSYQMSSNPYEEVPPQPQETSPTECYRLSFFTRKTEALTVITDADYGSTTTADQAPALTSTSKRTSKLPVTRRFSSFSNCVKPSQDEDTDANQVSQHDNDTEDHEWSYSTLRGCVTSPISSRSNSWSNLLDSELAYTSQELVMADGDQPTEQSNMVPSSENLKHFWIVTTAALPWWTGTAINPLLRAAYLSQRNRMFAHGESTVTLVLPWLESAEDRVALYGNSWKEATQHDQDVYIRHWLEYSARLPLEANPEQGGIVIQWYPARYHAGLSSIFAMGDLCQLIPHHTANTTCILEEPEHVNFYRAPGRLSWRDRFSHVIGIVHTNYKAYAASHYSGLVTGPLVGAMSSLMVRAYCDKVVKLSPVLQSYAPEKEVVSNVHGIRSDFFLKQSIQGQRIYFIGKLLWAKGLDKLLDLQATYRKMTGEYFEMDIFGSGPQQEDIQRAFLHPYLKTATSVTFPSNTSTSLASRLPPISPREWRRQPIPARFLGRQDHASVGEEYKVFVNPSITEVLCTTTAESIAMGKWVIVPKHPSNQFFIQFPNCLQYSSKLEFVQLLQHALAHDPCPTCLASELQYPLTWEAATDRFLTTACIHKRDARRRDRVGKTKLDETIAKLHYELCKGVKGDVIRKVMGGGPVAEQYQYEKRSSSPIKDRSNDTQRVATAVA